MASGSFAFGAFDRLSLDARGFPAYEQELREGT
jgi:hypothetical protein